MAMTTVHSVKHFTTTHMLSIIGIRVAGCPTQHVIGHFGYDRPSQSFDWSKKLVFLTNH